MLPIIARNLVCPLHELLLGRRTFAYLRELEESQWFSPDELRCIQEMKLRELLQHAETNTRFYRNLFQDCGVDVRTEDPFEVLSRLPLLEKSTIHESIEAMVWSNAPGGLFKSNTGGSSGEPLMFYMDRRRQGYDQAARIRTHRWFGVDIGDRELYLWGSPIEAKPTDRLKRLRDHLFNQRLLSAFNLSPDSMSRYVEAWNRFRPSCVFGYPSSLALFAEHVRSSEHKLDTRCLRAAFVTGEVCFPEHREVISSVLSAPVADCYGSRDAGFITHECPEGSSHITSENVIVEIIGKHGRPLPPGNSGEIVITHLDAYAMPFIRYRTGDVGRLKSGRCACGRGLAMMDVVNGRTTDFLYLPDGTAKHALSIIYPLREISGLRQFHITQHEDYAVTVNVVCDDRNGRISVEAVAAAVRPVLAGQVPVSVELVDSIPSTPSGKHRFVKSDVRNTGSTFYEEAATGE